MILKIKFTIIEFENDQDILNFFTKKLVIFFTIFQKMFLLKKIIRKVHVSIV